MKNASSELAACVFLVSEWMKRGLRGHERGVRLVKRGLYEWRGIRMPEKGVQKRMHRVQTTRRGLHELRGIQKPERGVRAPGRGIHK